MYIEHNLLLLKGNKLKIKNKTYKIRDDNMTRQVQV